MDDLDELADAATSRQRQPSGCAPTRDPEPTRVVYVPVRRGRTGTGWKLIALLGVLLALPGGVLTAMSIYNPEPFNELVIKVLSPNLWRYAGGIAIGAFIVGILLFTVGRIGAWFSE